MSNAKSHESVSATETEICKSKNAIESITMINDELWESGGLFSQHVTIVDRSPTRRFIPRLTPLKPIPNEETRGYSLFSACTQTVAGGRITRGLVITADNKFSIKAEGQCVYRSSSTYSEYEALVPTGNGEHNESSIFIGRSALLPLTELPEPCQVLNRLMLDVNDRMSRSLHWHINLASDQTVTIAPGGVVYM